MKRNPILQPLSREHHTALTLAKSCERAAKSGDVVLVDKACQRVIRAFSDALEPHFQFEEVSLLPLLHSTETQPLIERTLADHQQLRGLLDALRQNDATHVPDSLALRVHLPDEYLALAHQPGSPRLARIRSREGVCAHVSRRKA